AADAGHVFHLYVIRSGDRDGLQRGLRERGIDTLIHYPIPVHRQTAYRELAEQGPFLPQTERAAGEVLSLPLYPELPLETVARLGRRPAVRRGDVRSGHLVRGPLPPGGRGRRRRAARVPAGPATGWMAACAPAGARLAARTARRGGSHRPAVHQG